MVVLKFRANPHVAQRNRDLRSVAVFDDGGTEAFLVLRSHSVPRSQYDVWLWCVMARARKV